MGAHALAFSHVGSGGRTFGRKIRRIRVLVANDPRLMRELVIATLSEESGIEIIGAFESSDQIPLVHQVRLHRPDFLILTLAEDGHRPQACDVLLRCFPHLRILAIAGHGDQCVLYRMDDRIRSSRIELSTGGLLNAVRGHAKPAWREEPMQRRRAG